MERPTRRQVLCTRWRLSWPVACFLVMLGCDELIPKAPVVKEKTPHVCRVSSRLVSIAWNELGGGIERAIVSASTLPGMERVEEVSAEGARFELRLPPGKYAVPAVILIDQEGRVVRRYHHAGVPQLQSTGARC